MYWIELLEIRSRLKPASFKSNCKLNEKVENERQQWIVISWMSIDIKLLMFSILITHVSCISWRFFFFILGQSINSVCYLILGRVSMFFKKGSSYPIKWDLFSSMTLWAWYWLHTQLEKWWVYLSKYISW